MIGIIVNVSLLISLILRLDPVWQKLEEENSEFFRAYYIRLMLKKQIIMFNNLLEHQCHLLNHPATPKAPLASLQNGIHMMAGNSPMCRLNFNFVFVLP